MRSKKIFCPKCSPVHENRAKVIISPTCFATFRDISLFRFCFCDCFFRGGPRGPFSMGTQKIANLEVKYLQNDETCLKTLWRSPRGPYGGPITRASGHESHTRSQYRSRGKGAQGAQGAQMGFFQWDSQNRKFGGITSTKRRNLLKNPLEVPKRTLWRP